MTSIKGVSMRDMMMWRVDRFYRDPSGEVLFGCCLNLFIFMISTYADFHYLHTL